LANNENAQLLNNKYGSETYVRKEAKIEEIYVAKRKKISTNSNNFSFFSCYIKVLKIFLFLL